MAKKKQKSNKKSEIVDFYEDSDETFAFIAGYTEGGVPFGTTWEELELEPFASPEEIEKAYNRIDGIGEESGRINESNYKQDGEIWDIFT